MNPLSQRILALLSHHPRGLSDREIGEYLFGNDHHHQHINQTCNKLAQKQQIVRDDSFRPTRNILIGSASRNENFSIRHSERTASSHDLSEDALKQHLHTWLAGQNWETTIAWGKTHGIDIEARKGPHRWLIEVKGIGSLSAMRVNYFLAILGEILQRMNDDSAKYSIALPKTPQFIGLWNRFPDLAKQRTGISALFVDSAGNVEEVPGTLLMT